MLLMCKSRFFYNLNIFLIGHWRNWGGEWGKKYFLHMQDQVSLIDPGMTRSHVPPGKAWALSASLSGGNLRDILPITVTIVISFRGLRSLCSECSRQLMAKWCFMVIAWKIDRKEKFISSLVLVTFVHRAVLTGKVTKTLHYGVLCLSFSLPYMLNLELKLKGFLNKLISVAAKTLCHFLFSSLFIIFADSRKIFVLTTVQRKFISFCWPHWKI